ncbi:hypothetical protein LELG_05749, partial [Lodderomyces elongisporus NRRL YB-4239]
MVFTKFRFFVKGVRLTLFVNQLPIVQIFQAYGTTKTPVDPRIQRWIAKLLCYNFDVIHISGATNYVADHMSRNPTFFQSPGSISIVGAVNVVKVPQEWIEDFHQAYLDDPAFSTVFKLLYHLETTNTELPDYTLDPKTRLLYLQERLCIPHQLLPQFLHLQHVALTGGHLGKQRFLQNIKPHYYFPKMTGIISNYVDLCIVCQRHKYNNLAPASLLQPFPPPKGRWTNLNMDLISGYPDVEFYGRQVNAILTIVCRFSRRVHFYPISTKFSAVDMAFIFQHFYVPLHGIPTTITTDRGPQFTSETFQSFATFLRIKSNISVANHQQSNGLAEAKNKQVEQYLRLYIQSLKDWPQLLLIAKFVLSLASSAALGRKSPFEVDLSYIPKAPSTLIFFLYIPPLLTAPRLTSPPNAPSNCC